jgi:hypothetical protein
MRDVACAKGELVRDAALAPALVLAQQEHSPPAGAHVVLLAGLVGAALVVVGVRWWRGRRDAAADRRSRTHDRSGEGTGSTGD